MPQLIAGLVISGTIAALVYSAGGMDYFSEPRGRLPLLLGTAFLFGMGLTLKGALLVLRGDLTGEEDARAGTTNSRWFATCEICGKTMRIPTAGQPMSHPACRASA